MGKKNEFYLKDGCWYRNGVYFPYLARIRPDYCLSIEEVRDEIIPYSFV
jgi:hypothetical protein